MGFSLKAFFENLQALIDDQGMDDAHTLLAIAIYLKREREYAEACGQLS